MLRNHMPSIPSTRWLAALVVLVATLASVPLQAQSVPTPDLTIKKLGGAISPNDKVIQTVDCGTDAVYLIYVKNVGSTAGVFYIKTFEDPSDWYVRYYYNGVNKGTEIRSSTGWKTPSIGAGKTLAYPIELRVRSHTFEEGILDVQLKARYNSYPPADDVIAETVSVCYNQPPVAVDDTVTTYVNRAITIYPLNNDYDPDGQPLTIVQVNQPPTGQGRATLNPGGTSITYTPPYGKTGTFAFTYAISDGYTTDTGTIVVRVLSTAPAPVSGVKLVVTPTRGTVYDYIDFTASPAPGPGNHNLLYQFQVRKSTSSSWSTIQSYSTQPWHSSPPCSPGTWYCRVLMRDVCCGKSFTSNTVTIYITNY